MDLSRREGAGWVSEGVEWTPLTPAPEWMSICREEHGLSTRAWQLRTCLGQVCGGGGGGGLPWEKGPGG